MDHPIIYILGALLVIYFAISIFNKRKGKKRRSREFMQGQRLKDRHKEYQD